jgi:Tol biopolymer transport system component
MHSLASTEGATVLPFFWSWDSRSLVFQVSSQLKRVALSGGAPETVCDLTGTSMVGGSWNSSGVIIVGTNPGGIRRVPATGGTCSPVTLLDPSRKETHHIGPTFLPDGKHFLYLRVSTIPEGSGISVGSVEADPQHQSAERLLSTSYMPEYLSSAEGASGQLLYYRDGTVLARAFDHHRLQFIGDPVPIAEHVASFLQGGAFRTSGTGVLVYKTGADEAISRPVWVDRRGARIGGMADVEPAAYFVGGGASLAPDGRVVLPRLTGIGTDADLWIVDVLRGKSSRFTFGPGQNVYPLWSADGSRIAFRSNREGARDLYQKVADRTRDEQPLLKSPELKVPTSWSLDGRFILYTVQDPITKGDIWILPSDRTDKPARLIGSPSDETDAQFSPDGHWIAYTSDLTGRREVYVAELTRTPGAATSVRGRWPISQDEGGRNPLWRRDGKELFYAAPDGTIKAVDVAIAGPPQAGTPRSLFTLAPTATLSTWLVSPDGQRFVIAAPAQEGPATPFTVVLNWPAALKK